MNLTTTPWIPAIRNNGSSDLFSLLDLFENGEEIRDITVNPPRRIALMRFLICICQAALDGPEDESHWIACRTTMADAVKKYLTRLKDRFDLYGETPFLQIKDLTVKEGNEKKAIKPLGTLDFQSPFGGSNTPLFDRQSITQQAMLSEAEIPLNLLTVLNFSAGGKVGQSQWEKSQFNHPTFAAPCIKHLHTVVIGDNIIETLHWNLLCKKDSPCAVSSLPNGEWGKPVWEKFPSSAGDTAAWDNAFKSYLGRLVPLSRLSCLTKGQCILGPVPPEYKLDQLPKFREPTTTVLLSQKQSLYCVAVSSSRHVWRDLSSVLAKAEINAGISGPVVLGRIRLLETQSTNKKMEIWTGGLETGATAAKLSDMAEWRLRFPIAMLGSSQLLIYEKGILLAKNGEFCLKSAVKVWAQDQKSEQPPIDTAQRIYWSILDNCYGILVRAASQEKSLSDQWYGKVRSAMAEAYSKFCPHITARQIRAFTRGKEKLRLKKPE